MKKLFTKLIAIGLLCCTMITGAVLPSYASGNRAYIFNSGTKTDSHGSTFNASSTIHATGQLFNKASALGYIQTKNASISIYPIYLTSILKVRYDDSSLGFAKAVHYCGVLQANTKYVVNMAGDYGCGNYYFDQSKVVERYSAGARATKIKTESSTDYFPQPLSSTFDWTIGLTLQEIFDSWGS